MHTHTLLNMQTNGKLHSTNGSKPQKTVSLSTKKVISYRFETLSWTLHSLPSPNSCPVGALRIASWTASEMHIVSRQSRVYPLRGRSVQDDYADLYLG